MVVYPSHLGDVYDWSLVLTVLTGIRRITIEMY